MVPTIDTTTGAQQRPPSNRRRLSVEVSELFLAPKLGKLAPQPPAIRRATTSPTIFTFDVPPDSQAALRAHRNYLLLGMRYARTDSAKEALAGPLREVNHALSLENKNKKNKNKSHNGNSTTTPPNLNCENGSLPPSSSGGFGSTLPRLDELVNGRSRSPSPSTPSPSGTDGGGVDSSSSEYSSDSDSDSDNDSTVGWGRRDGGIGYQRNHNRMSLARLRYRQRRRMLRAALLDKRHKDECGGEGQTTQSPQIGQKHLHHHRGRSSNLVLWSETGGSLSAANSPTSAMVTATVADQANQRTTATTATTSADNVTRNPEGGGAGANTEPFLVVLDNDNKLRYYNDAATSVLKPRPPRGRKMSRTPPPLRRSLLSSLSSVSLSSSSASIVPARPRSPRLRQRQDAEPFFLIFGGGGGSSSRSGSNSNPSVCINNSNKKKAQQIRGLVLGEATVAAAQGQQQRPEQEHVSQNNHPIVAIPEHSAVNTDDDCEDHDDVHKSKLLQKQKKSKSPKPSEEPFFMVFDFPDAATGASESNKTQKRHHHHHRDRRRSRRKSGRGGALVVRGREAEAEQAEASPVQ